jgi:hypothetical protein
MHIRKSKPAALFSAMSILAMGAEAGWAGVTPGAVYSNLTTATGSEDNGGGTTLGGVARYTNMIADDLDLIGGGSVAQFTVDIVNNNSSTVTFQPVFPFYSPNGTGGGPGTEVSALFTPAITMTAGENEDVTIDLGAGELTVSPGIIWAGLVFSNAGTLSITAAQLALLGQGTFNPPDVGSSQDRYFLGSSSGAPFDTNDPSGSITSFGGSPVANFGWEIVVPEPSSSGLALAIICGSAQRRRRK